MTLIAGRYQLFESGRPGASERARDLQTAQTVLLREVVVADDTIEEALARARSAVGIFHPSLVTLFDVVPPVDGKIVLAYEFVSAQTVAQVAGGHPFHAKRAAAIVAEVADAVAELHARGVSHGAISQSTVLVTMKGKAKLDRTGDPSLNAARYSAAHDDLRALGELLQQLVGRSAGGGVAGLHGLEVIINRAREGKFESAATLSALLRRL